MSLAVSSTAIVREGAPMTGSEDGIKKDDSSQ
jgi:hypothetical protein